MDVFVRHFNGKTFKHVRRVKSKMLLISKIKQEAKGLKKTVGNKNDIKQVIKKNRQKTKTIYSNTM
jgi:hypothetical protein